MLSPEAERGKPQGSGRTVSGVGGWKRHRLGDPFFGRQAGR